MDRKCVVLVNVAQWIEDNRQYFVPPVCNKFMHSGEQLDVMFVGGPNERKDYHIEGGEELFYQIQGDMVLKVLERGQHKDIRIKEGEMFLLPRAIPHSPQRGPNTVGLVIERQRHPLERDALRFFTESADGKMQEETLYEVWFEWGKQKLPELFAQFLNSEQARTGKPKLGMPDRHREEAITVDAITELEAPFHFKEWIVDHRTEIDTLGKLPLFNRMNQQMSVSMYGKGTSSDISDVSQIWIWQISGDSELTCQEQQLTLSINDSALVPIGNRFTLRQNEGSLALVIYQDPTKSPFYPKH